MLVHSFMKQIQRPKAVVFDLGKVLVDFDYSIAARALASRVRLSLAELEQTINQSPLLHQYEAGLMTTEEFFKQFQAMAGYDGGFEEFADLFGNIFTEIEPMVAVHGALCDAGVPTYLLSNTNELAIRNVRRNFPFFGRFNHRVLSYEQRLMKPDPAIYAVVEEVAGLRGADLIFLDDRPENVASAVARGWQGVVHQSPLLSRVALEGAGFLTEMRAESRTAA